MRLFECGRQRLHVATCAREAPGDLQSREVAGALRPVYHELLAAADPWSVAEEVKPSTISTAQLHPLPDFHAPPIKQVVSLRSYPVNPVGNLISRRASHLDALGAPPGYVGYEEGGQLTNRMKSNPFCVLLFDEIEKAHPSVLDKFLQILDDGRMTNGRGETVYFSESIIIFTSNIGIYQLDPETGDRRSIPSRVAAAARRSAGRYRVSGGEGEDTGRRAVLFQAVLGRPELLNRIGQNIVVFDFIRRPVMREILERKVLKSIQAQVNERWKLTVEFAPAVLDGLVEIGGLDVASGGRGMGNLAEAALLNPLARTMFALLEEEGTLENKILLVTGVIPPSLENNYRYDITWEVR